MRTKSKPVIFLSHMHEERDIAIILKTLLESSFLDAINVFVSSDNSSNSLGEKWLDKITTELKGCKAMIILCSKISVQRPWINFEAGAGWIRDIPVIPICYAGITKGELPIPLNTLNAIEMKSEI